MSNEMTIEEWFEEMQQYFSEEIDQMVIKNLEDFVESQQDGIQFIKHEEDQ